ncbi:MAG: ATP-grasp domain-containing protein, partial [Lysobacterales bacterium]
MIILSGPWLSSHFIETVVANGWPLVDAGGAAELLENTGAMLLEPGAAARNYRLRPGGRVLTSGEQALEWVTRELRGTEEARGASLFKDKTEFRRLMKPDYPELAFRELPLAEISAYVPEPGFYPFVIKPAVGFFSIGVHTVHSPEEWHKVRAQIAFEISSARRHFPEHMLSQERLLLESFIDGEEFAVDAYFDDEGNPVVLNVLEHRFASPQD